MKYKTVLLTRPPTGSNPLQGGDDRDPYPQPALGLAYIASVLEGKTEVLPILDGNFSDDYLMDLATIVKNKSPDVVGFSAFTPFARKAMEGAKVIKEIDPEILVMLGGPHGTVLYNSTLQRCPEIDLILRDEGEITVQEVMDGKPLKDVAGIVYRNNGKIVMTPGRPYIKNLDGMPFPAYHLLPNFPEGYKPHPPKSAGGIWASAMWSRGCPFTCSYCTRDASFGLNFRCNSPGYVVNLLNFLHSEYSIDELTFYDDVFSLNRKITMELLDAMQPNRLGFDLSWDCETRVDLVDPELLRMMKRAGNRSIAYGIEHGVWVLEVKGGRATIEQVEKAVRWTHEAGIQTAGYFMIGLPGETKETIQKTIDFAKKLNVTWAQFAITTPFPGNELYKQAVRSGLVNLDDDWDKYVYASLGKVETPMLTTSDLSKEDLVYWSRRAYREFYFRPSYILHRMFSIRSWRDFSTYFAGLRMLTNMIRA